MIKIIFFGLLLISLLEGFLAYYNPSSNDINPMKFMMDKSGYTSIETVNRKNSQYLHTSINKGMVQVRRQMDDTALKQDKFLESIKDQQENLKNNNKDPHNILLESKEQTQAQNERSDDLEQRSKDFMDEQNQRQEDRRAMIRQSIQDQEQRMQRQQPGQ